jgi:GH25 family lysozyme M1 (1,4-beta-N-acetylmuramidase)
MADRIKGLDVSDHQADWKPSPSYHFVFIKATEGQSWKAQKAAQHARRARDTGYVVGWYHFLWPSAKSGNPSTQAMWFLNNIPDLRVGDLLVCDWEPTKGGTPTRSDKNLFMAAVKKARGNRNKVGLYLNASMWNSSDKKAGDFLWVARYGADDGVAEKWQFWQFTDKPIDQNWGRFRQSRRPPAVGHSVPAEAAHTGAIAATTILAARRRDSRHDSEHLLSLGHRSPDQIQ